ncbi:nuclear pore membrane glycoprotein 210 [Neocloeon triangulifer]|uniref:nuclear pore membrane glycoprotein 210 n=1 Tax=Neocloeon triangulifer TaxID=2078957 RepID=UPI00286F356F|nr:nuclear pore membrane glycoprotein 210 [Neocloeon triangulifer]
MRFAAVAAALLLLGASPDTSDAAKLNTPRVLLPLYSQFPNNFTLHVDDGGCYKWSTKNPTTIQLTVVEAAAGKGCSSEAVVSAVISEVGRHTAIIIAEDAASGEVLRCDVIVDSIASLSIVTTTREIFIEEAPEVFEVQAYDDLGNKFTTLEGFAFEWQVRTVSKRAKDGVIKVLRFEDSHYNTPSQSLAEIESAGLHGSKVLLYGVSTGQVEVTVALAQPQYQNVRPAPSVILAVVANLLLDPLDTLLMPYTKVRYQLELVRHGRQENLALPSEQYQLEVQDSAIASLQSDGVIVEALSVGKTRILLRDMNAVDDEEGRTTSATLRVANPTALDIQVLPHKSWQLIAGRHYELHASILDANRHVFHIGEGLHINIEANPKYFSNDRKTASVLFGRAQLIGTIPVTASLPDTQHSLLAKKHLVINEQVKVKPKVTYLPWSKTPKPYEIQLEATARTGDGSAPSFVWQSRSPRVASVSQEGVVTSSEAANVSVWLDKDPLNVAQAQVRFLPPCKLSIVGRNLQAEAGSTLHVPVQLLLCDPAGLEVKAADCRHAPLAVETSDKVRKLPKNGGPLDAAAGSCASVLLTSDAALLTSVRVTLDVQLPNGDLLTLEDTTTISFYKPLRVLHPTSALTVLAPGSSRNVIFEGGPRAMTGLAKPGRKISIANPALAQWSDVDQNSVNHVIVRVLCNKVGETELALSLSLGEGDAAVEAKGVVKVVCAMPDSLTLTPRLPTPDYDACSISAGTLVALSSQEVTVEVTAFDSHLRKFDNFSSVRSDWTLDPRDAVHALPAALGNDPVRDDAYGVFLPGSAHHTLRPLGQSNLLTVTATLTAAQVQVKAQAAILFLEEVQLSPSSLTVYNHSSKLNRMKISKGSNSFLLNIVDGKDVIDINLAKQKRAVEITPKKPGHARISVVDACLPKETRRAAVGEVTVLGIGSVVVSVASQVQEGSTVEGSLTIVGTDGQQMTPPTAALVKHKEDATKIQVDISDTSPLHFKVTGLKLGNAELRFEVDNVLSHPVNINVFPPIKIWPSDLVLVPGSVMQVLAKGGPKVPDAVLEFSSSSPERPSCLDTTVGGMMEARCTGSGRVSVKAVAPDGHIYSQDSAPVRIVALSAVEVATPTTVLEQGTRMPAYLVGKSDTGEVVSPFVVATLEAKCVWADHGGRLHVKSSDSVVHVDAVNVGMAELSATFQLGEGTVFTSTAAVEVIPAQRLTLPPNAPSAAPILIAPFSKVQLRASSGKFFLDCGGEGIMSVSEGGLVTSAGPLGRGTIVVSDHKTNQKLVVGVAVVPVAYVMAQAASPLGVFARGMQTPVHVTYHDAIGREMVVPSEERRLEWMSSRPQTLALTNDLLQLGELGRAVLDLWDGAQHAFLKLQVRPIVRPTALSQGDVVCYHVGRQGNWSTLADAALQVDATTGWAVALGPGDANLNFVSSEGVTTWAEIQVSPATSVAWLSPSPSSFSSNAPLLAKVLIKTNNKSGAKKSSLVEGKCDPPASKLPSAIECKVAWEDGSYDPTLSAEPVYDFQGAQHACQVSASSGERSKKLMLMACLRDSTVCTDRLGVTFFSPVEVAAKEVVLSEQAGQVVLSGPSQALGKVRVEPTPELEIGHAREVGPDAIAIPVRLTDAFWALPHAHRYGSVLLRINSPLTGQTFILPVLVDKNVQAPMCPNKPALFTASWDLLYSFRTEIIFAICMVIVIAAASNLYFANNSYTSRGFAPPPQQVQNNSPFLNRSGPSTSPNGSNSSYQSNLHTPGRFAYTGYVYGNQQLDNSWGSPGRH